MKYLLAFLLCVILTFTSFKLGQNASVNTASEEPVTVLAYQEDTEEVLWALVQTWRIEQGLEPFTRSSPLCSIAKRRSMEKESGHTGFESHFQEFSSMSGYPVLAENISLNYTSSRGFLDGWLNSPPHRKTLEDPYLLDGCIKCSDSYCVHIFGGYE